MSKVRVVLAATVLACAGTSALAHHSAQMYNFAKTEHVDGVVKEIRVINPHMSLTLAISDAQGTHDVAFEGHSVNNFYRAGWRPNMVKVGDKITVRFAPRRDGAEGGYVTGFITAQGHDVAFGLPTAEERRGAAAPSPPPNG
jgi:hypothetical protein